MQTPPATVTSQWSWDHPTYFILRIGGSLNTTGVKLGVRKQCLHTSFESTAGLNRSCKHFLQMWPAVIMILPNVFHITYWRFPQYNLADCHTHITGSSGLSACWITNCGFRQYMVTSIIATYPSVNRSKPPILQWRHVNANSSQITRLWFFSWSISSW